MKKDDKIEQMINLIEEGDFRTAYKFAIELGSKITLDGITNIVYTKNDNIIWYSFICYLISKNYNLIACHEASFFLFDIQQNYLEGASELSKFHIKELIYLEPKNIFYKYDFILLHVGADNITSDDEVFDVILEMIELFPNYKDSELEISKNEVLYVLRSIIGSSPDNIMARDIYNKIKNNEILGSL